ncbi:hypothetical protein C4565_10535 [Candidatus Parcubacteria bacterium]|nr:MAG: hypothetical protein C4565_10535 [Candidatus Parcubacteria bacterium]
MSSRLLKNTSIYILGEGAILVSSLVSFPILTRLLTKSDYGILSLITLSVSLAESLFSFGLGHAIQRFYSDHMDKGDVDLFHSTSLIAAVSAGIIGSILTLGASKFLSMFNIISDEIFFVSQLAALLTLIRIIIRIFGSFLRAQELSKKYVILSISAKYSGMFLAIILIHEFELGINGFFIGLLLGELVVILLYLKLFLSSFVVRPLVYSHKLTIDMIKYGFPMVLSGLAMNLLNLGDRYIIGYFMTTADVANYSVPYNLCMYLQGTIVTAFQFAMVPSILKSLKTVGEVNAIFQIKNIIKMYCFISVPLFFGIITVGEDIIVFLASEKYRSDEILIPFIMAGVFFSGLHTPLTIGLLIYKKSIVLLKISILAALINMIMNILLVPVLGLVGAALSTLISYVLFVSLGAFASSKLLKIMIPWKPITRYISYSILSLSLFYLTKIYVLHENIFFQITAGISSYVFLLLLFDCDVKRNIKNIYNSCIN